MSTQYLATGNADCLGSLDGVEYYHELCPTGEFKITSDFFYVGGCEGGFNYDTGLYETREDYDPCGRVVVLGKGQRVEFTVYESTSFENPDEIMVTVR